MKLLPKLSLHTMPDQLVPKELAVMLKEAGYSEPCDSYFKHNTEEDKWCEFSGMIHDHNSRIGFYYSRPTLSQAADFLRDKGLHVHVAFTEGYWAYTIQTLDGFETNHVVGDGIIGMSDYLYKTHDTALTAGITKALTILKEGTI